ncbi:MAG TPA: cytochrome c3 family protein [Polyangiaceae bacterium]|nr:cytochrome c3 family protein [Polyangiaceae bacterium]
MTRSAALARVALALLALVALTLARPARAQLLSPGPLSRSHATLEGDTHCGDCHTSGKRVDQGLCLKCHADLGARVAAGQGLHGLQFKGSPCESCHVEHVGGGVPTRWPGGGPNNLDHAQTGWPLEGAHKSAPCGKCHNRTNTHGAPTFLGLTRACASCHKDAHEGRFGAACASCHRETTWKDLDPQGLRGFDHDLARFPLRGAHTSVPCAKCHADPPRYTGLRFTACGDCHKDPHAGRLGAGCADCHQETAWKPVTFKQSGAKHPGLSLANGHAAVACASCHDRGNLAAPSRGSACVSCHPPVHQAPLGTACAGCHGAIVWLGLPRQVGLAAHPKTAYPLTGKHEEVPCAGCHKPGLARDARYRKLAFDRCTACHDDKHGGEFARVEGGECGGCHTTGGFRPPLFGVDAHAATRFALVGKHVAAPCSSCHSAPRPRLDLRVAKQACADCHANPHGDQFAAEMSGGGCAHCHEATGWNLPKIDHSSWPLTGAHATTSCNSCHHPTAEDRKAGHGASYRGVPRDCGGCHDERHLGQFRLTEPALGCDRCHSTRTFKIASFDHQAITGWALTGAHARTDCAGCHPPATLAGGPTTTRWRGPSRECAFCHANPHDDGRTAAAGASAAPARRGFTDAVSCSACHSTTAWRARDAAGAEAHEAKFDHAKTGFPLTGRHMHASCVGCHKTGVALKRDCAACHEDEHRGRLSQACDGCHVPAGWKVKLPLEIHRMTRFPLTGMHVLADCTQCHLRASERRFSDAPVDCYACHQQDYQRPGIFPHTGSATTPPLPRDCSLCHRAVAWVPASVPAGLVASTGSPLRAQAAPPEHDVRFPISFGAHRVGACVDCHASIASPRSVRCVGCHAHDVAAVRQQHRRSVPTDGPSCVTCHPAGVRR